MKLDRRFSPIAAWALALSLLATQSPLFTEAAAAGARASQEQTSPSAAATLERGYRTGYSDGYQTGYRDSAENAPRDFLDKDEYKNADRTYTASYGSREDFRDGYQQGYEAGYEAGFDRRDFDSAIPANLGRRGTVARGEAGDSSARPVDQEPARTNNSSANPARAGSSGGSSSVIPANTIMQVELLTNVSSDASARGDRVQARVTGPPEYEGAMIDGRVSTVKRAGKVRGTSQLQLTFDQIRLPDNRWADFEAQVIEVTNPDGTLAGEVDPEGGVRGRDSTKSDAAKVGAGAAVGAVLGAIFGGGKGAAVGAVLGGATTTGGVLTSRGEDIRLSRGSQLRIRTSRETRFQ